MSAEHKPYQPTKEDLTSRDPFQEVLRFTGQVAHGFNLDAETSQVLEEFATISLRIRQVTKDFQGTKRVRKDYYLGVDDKGKPITKRITLLNYEKFLKIHSKIAFNMYGEYLFGSETTRQASSQVQDHIDEIMPLR